MVLLKKLKVVIPLKFIDGDNISITQNGKDFTIATKKDVTFDTVTANDTITAPKVKATTGVETPEVTGLTNKTWVPGQTQPVSGRAATEDQLKKLMIKLKLIKTISLKILLILRIIKQQSLVRFS